MYTYCLNFTPELSGGQESRDKNFIPYTIRTSENFVHESNFSVAIVINYIIRFLISYGKKEND